MEVVDHFVSRFRGSKLFKDSFWAVFGNGLGYGLLLISGIIIARFLGNDLYGEYGLVKTTMFSIAAFSTFGLGYTSTKFVADHVSNNKENVYSVAKASLIITIVSSFILSIILFLLSSYVAKYLNIPSLSIVFRVLGLVVVVRAFLTTLNGILAGFKEFKSIAVCNVISGVVMLLTAVPFTYFFQLNGALASLALSQVVNVLLNWLAFKRVCANYPKVKNNKIYKEILLFSLPVALQELSYAIAGWAFPIVVVKFSDLGQYGIFTAAAQWNAIILFIPGLLYNVVLSYLSSSVQNNNYHSSLIGKMLLVNLLSTLIPFLLVLVLSDFISSFYGETFVGLSVVINYCTFATLFSACSRVFQSEFIAMGYNWTLFVVRAVNDFFGLSLTILFLYFNETEPAAKVVAISTVISSISYFAILFFVLKIRKRV